MCRSRVCLENVRTLLCQPLLRLFVPTLRLYTNQHDKMFTSQTDGMFNMLLAELPLELLTAVQKNKLCDPGTLRSYPRTMAFVTMDSSLVVSTGVPCVAVSSSSTELAIPTPLFPTSAPPPEQLDGCTSGAVIVPDPEDVED